MINDMCCHTLAQLSPDGRGVNTSTVGAVIMHQSPKLQVCPSGCHLTINYKTFLLLTVFSRCPTAMTQENNGLFPLFWKYLSSANGVSTGLTTQFLYSVRVSVCFPAFFSRRVIGRCTGF